MTRVNHLSQELRAVVSQSVSILGDVICHELGKDSFLRIEKIRYEMSQLRKQPSAAVLKMLHRTYQDLEKLNRDEQLNIGRAFTLMLELMNTCENAYRSLRIRERQLELSQDRPDSIIYVLTAHPTEVRSPQNIRAFQEIQRILIKVMVKHQFKLRAEDTEQVRHWLEIAWKAPAIRKRKPRVHDEAEHIYSTLLREETLHTFLKAGHELAPIYARSWVGGDKDGHPGVNEHTFRDSLQVSRSRISHFIQMRLNEIIETTQLVRSKKLNDSSKKALHHLKTIHTVLPGDAKKVIRLRYALRHLIQEYEIEIGAPHPALMDLKQLLRAFPAFVVPLEFRESSDILRSSPTGKGLAIYQMLRKLAQLSQGTDPRWYVRGLIVSMAGSLQDVLLAAGLVKRVFRSLLLPIIPLFEQNSALEAAPSIVLNMLRKPELLSALKAYWGGNLEVMLGYSDSSKESGVLPSRLKIAEAMYKVDHLCQKHGVTPLFFQGSGGSVDRGGGSIAEQTAWWTSGALKNFKVTIQGEMVERALASPEITRGQFERIVESAGKWKKAKKRGLAQSAIVQSFASRVAQAYREKIHDPTFLHVIESATPYRFLDVLKIGSRPSKRATSVSVEGLRAIPWVLCWTQTRILFPTWWGIGNTWNELNEKEKKALRRSYRTDPVFSTFVRALGFTLTKIELPIWRLYLEKSGLPMHQVEKVWKEFNQEKAGALSFTHALLGKDILGWRPWLEESIVLRSPMIHPLNLLQIIALQNRDFHLLRMTLLGISSGMMTTG